MKFLLFLITVFCCSYGNTQAIVLTNSNLPIVVIKTGGQAIVDDPKITADMGIIYNGPNIRNNITDPFNNYNGKIGIELRGQSSQSFPMKSYGVELRMGDGSSQNQSILGMPAESDWVLYAPYTDKTLMRNFLAYNLSNALGRYAAKCRFVELVLDNDYKGIYVLMEKIKPSRVGVVKMKKTDITGDALTGGYIFSLDKQANAWFSAYAAPKSTTNFHPQFSYVYPKPTDIVEAQKNYIKSFVDSFETALNSKEFQDSLIGVRKFADLPSFMDYFIVNEVSRNVDGYRLSSYFNKDRDSKKSKMFAGPVWDYDLAFRNANYCSGSNISGWAFQFNSVCSNDAAGLVPFWWDKLFTDSNYVKDLHARWVNVRSNILKIENVNHIIDSIVLLTEEARGRHFKRWPVLGQFIWPNPNPIPKNYQEEISTLKTWVDERIAWIDANLPTSVIPEWPANNQGSLLAYVFPNPINHLSVIKIQSRSKQTANLEIFNMLGKKILESQVNLNEGFNYLSNQLSSIPQGVNILVIQNRAGEKLVIKLVK